MKKFLAVLLAAVMVLGTVPVLAATPSGSIQVNIKDIYTNEPVSGVDVHLEYVSAGLYQSFSLKTTSSDGSVTFTDLPDGWYLVRQNSQAEGYIWNQNYTEVEIVDGAPQVLTMKNTPLHTLLIQRLSTTSSVSISGGAYEVRDSANGLVGTYTTGEDGKVLVTGLENGEYSVKETVAPTGAVQDGSIVNISFDDSTSQPQVASFSASDLGSITVILSNPVNGPLAGVSFDLTTTLGVAVATGVTDAYGSVSFTDLQPGAYLVAQTSLGEGYINDLPASQITLTQDDMDQTVKLQNDLMGSILIRSTASDGSALAGVTYYVYDEATLVYGGLVSDEAGLVQTSGLEAGEYQIVAAAPEGYVMDNDRVEVTVKVNETAEVDFSATGKGNLVISAVDEFGYSLGGVSFRVSKLNGEVLGTFVTSSEGFISLTALDPDTYIIEEVQVPAGYVRETAVYKTFIAAGETVTPKFVIRSQPFIVVETYIQGTNTPVSGVVYELYNSSGAKVGASVSNSDGKVYFEYLEPDVYSVKNVSVPDGYQIVTTAQTATVTETESDTKTFFVVAQSRLIIRSFDMNGDPLADTQFIVRNAQGVAIEALTTDASGTVVSRLHDPGAYYVEMTFAPEGYTPTLYRQTATVINLDNTYVDFICGKKSSIVVYAYDLAGEPVANADYAIVDGVTGNEVQQVTTLDTGIAVSEELTPGTYFVRGLTTPEGYSASVQLDIPVIVYADEASPVRFVYTHLGSITISSVDNTTNEILTYGEYTVEDAETGVIVGRYTVDGTGSVTTPGLPNGEYVVKQVVCQDGYKLRQESQRVTIYGDLAQTCVFRNERLSGLIIESVVQTTHEALAGGSFEVYDEQQKQIYCGPADEDGKIYLLDIAPGTYFVKHITAADGYRVVDSERKVVITVNEPTTAVFENVALTSLTVQIMDSYTKEMLAGVRFKVQTIDGEYIQEVVTDETGKATITELPVGTYFVSQIAPSEGYQLEPDYQWAEVKINEDTVVTFTNVRYSGLVIRAMELGSDVNLSGAVFQVYEKNGKLIGEYSTDAQGTIYTGILEPGEYLIKETVVPENYTAQTQTQTVTVTDSLDTTAIFYHEPYGNVTVRAYNALTGTGVTGAVFNVFTYDNQWVGQYTTNNSGYFVLPGLDPGEYILTLVKAPDSYLADNAPQTFTVSEWGSVLVEVPLETTSDFKILVTAKQDGEPVEDVHLKVTTLEGELVGNYVTDSNGAVYLVVMPGDYLVYETYGPDNVVLDRNPYNITFEATTQRTMELQVVRLSTIRVRFVDEETREPIYNVRFELKDKQNNWIGVYNSDNNGYVNLTDILADGSYVLTMLECPSNYILDEVPKTVEISTAEDTDVIWELAAQCGQLVITTKSETDNTYRNLRAGSLLPDAIYTIWDENGQVVNIIYGDQWGEAFSGALALGTYTIRQTTAPAYYLLNDNKITVNITDLNKKVNITVYNKSAEVGSTVDVEGPKTAYAGEEIKYFFSDVRNTSKTQVSSFLFHIKLPTDALRAGTLNTGTWTGTSKDYAISYKTNLSDYRTLASGLVAGSNYSFDLSSTALGLGDGEFVEDIRFEFEDVVGGFHCEMAPTLYAYLLPTLPTGYQVICKTEAALLYNGQWSKAVDSWTTTVTGSWFAALPGATGTTPVLVPNTRTIVIPSKLPKTGY